MELICYDISKSFFTTDTYPGDPVPEFMHSYPKAGVYDKAAINKLLVEHVIVEWDGLFDPLWNKIFKTDLIKK